MARRARSIDQLFAMQDSRGDGAISLVTNGVHILFIDVFESRLIINRPFADRIEAEENTEY